MPFDAHKRVKQQNKYRNEAMSLNGAIVKNLPVNVLVVVRLAVVRRAP